MARRYWWIFALLLGNTALAVMFPPDYWLLRFGSRHAVHITLIYFALSILLLILRQNKLMLVSFLCCAALCLHLRKGIGSTETDRFEFAKATKEVRLRIVQFNTSATDGDYVQNIDRIAALDPDIISVQELTPDWDEALNDRLSEKYPYSRSFRRIDFYGLAIYSKRPFSRIDTFQIDKKPNIICSIKVDSLHPDVFFINSHTPLTADGYINIRSFLNKVAQRIRYIDAPMFALGDYHVVPWSSEIQNFRQQTRLIEGRRDYLSTAPTPTDYIMHSKHFNCLRTEPLKDSIGAPIGIQGDYQFRADFRTIE